MLMVSAVSGGFAPLQMCPLPHFQVLSLLQNKCATKFLMEYCILKP